MRRSKFPSILLISVLSFVLLFGFAAFGAQDSDGDSVPNSEDKYPGRNDLKYGGTLTLARAEEPVTLDGMRTSFGDQAHQYISEPALLFGPHGEFGPAGWVKSFTQSEDETKLTFKIKKGITFHDGTKLDAEALAWLLRKRMKEDDIYSMPLKNVEKIKVLDKYTMQIDQSKPFPELPYMLATPDWLGSIQVPKAVEKYGEDYGKAEA
ncbi:MAG: ABC transporter substrate-binding protein, partial [Candidatus Bipolaricaulia bacterium]